MRCTALPVHPLALWLAVSSVLLHDSPHVDLTAQGYKPPPRQHLKGRALTASSRYLDFDASNNAVVGFVVRSARNQLSMPDNPVLTWHIVRFDQKGKCLSESSVPTRGWDDNEVFADDQGNVLLRATDELTLISPDGLVIARRSLPRRLDYRIHVLPSRRTFALSSIRVGRTDFVDMHTLATVSMCANTDGHSVASVSNNSVLAYSPSLSGDANVKQIRVSQQCGPLRYAFDERTESAGFSSSLLDDRTVVLAGYGQTVTVYDQGTERWRDSFRRDDFVDRDIRKDAAGRVFAVLVRTLGGGSRLLDQDAHVKAARVVVYRASDGKRLAEIPIIPLPLSVFDFALSGVSGDGTRLAVFSDGELRILSILVP